ncbi:MAG: PAS domain S-box protein [Desulfobacteraceae bacterium]|nr:PAS domain S-box protein [Desulfobacteraceae bacterium]
MRGIDMKHGRYSLFSVISGLPEGIIICDVTGQIVLCNKKAEQFLGLAGTESIGSSPLFSPLVGRPVTALIDKNLMEHTLDEINERLKRNVLDIVSYFTFIKQNHTFQARVTPVLNPGAQFSGFTISISDITRQKKASGAIEKNLQSLSKSARSPLASIRAAIEAMKQFPQMAQVRQEEFKNIIFNESIVLGNIIDQVSDSYATLAGTGHCLEPVLGVFLIETLARRSRDRLGILLNIEGSENEVEIKADPYSLILAMLFVLNQLKNKIGLWEFSCCISLKNKIVRIDFYWQGAVMEAATIKSWADQDIIVPDQKTSMTLKEVLNIHQGAVWPYQEEIPGKGPYLRFFFPAQEKKRSKSLDPIALLPESRFEFYNPELDERLLTELTYTSLLREITQVENLDMITGKHSQLPRLIHSMLKGGSKIRTITWLITIFSDAILEKIIGFAIQAVGPPPVPFAFITLGSEGRQEQTLKTDQDNAIIFQDPPKESGLVEKDVQQYFLELGKKICTWLDRAGYDFCLGGIMAQNPKWCQPLSTWKRYFSEWIHAPEPETLLHTSIFFDFRFSYGDRDITNSLEKHLFLSLRGWPGFYRHMTENAVYFRPPIGFWGNFSLESKGPNKNCLDIKMAMTPIVDFARIYSLNHGIRDTNTQARLYQLYLKQVLSRGEYSEIEQAYGLMMQIRFIRQANAIIGEKVNPDNFVNPKNLSAMERKMLKEILKMIKGLQNKLSFEFIGANNV